MNKTIKSTIYLGLAFLMMGLLFYSSSQPYGEQSVTGILDQLLANEPLKGLLSPIRFTYAGSEVSIAASGYNEFIEFFIRKAAHFGSYFLLALFWFLGLKERVSGVYLTALLSFMLTVGYASFDEFHQGLTPDRTPLLEDILLDSVGAFTAIVLSLLYFLVWKKSHSSKRKFKRTY
ncbi:VanZ family protein [Desemzia sp. RIT804]|uniref:VanZ family protein n=1 Tax=Desemzia sp. RIT 804 TaxID=2810209 RepID=UPI001950F122|nr:VanZ family protein [Desemzia sp. RIT 804]MBM6613350.1 VanZ family protein [Desemzia sp. RIT 804]